MCARPFRGPRPYAYRLHMLRVAGANRHRPDVRSRAHPLIRRTPCRLNAAHQPRARFARVWLCGLPCAPTTLLQFLRRCVVRRFASQPSRCVRPLRSKPSIPMTGRDLANVIRDGVGIASAEFTMATPPSSAAGADSTAAQPISPPANASRLPRTAHAATFMACVACAPATCG